MITNSVYCNNWKKKFVAVEIYEQMFIFAEMKCERDNMRNVERERESLLIDRNQNYERNTS